MINSVRNTVLSVLNKNNYGYISPSDFNLYAKQAQLEVYEEYFSNINKAVNMENARMSGTDYADLYKAMTETVETFLVNKYLVPTSSTNLYTNVFSVPSLTTTGDEAYLINKIVMFIDLLKAGTNTAVNTNQLIDSGADFIAAGVKIGDIVVNRTVYTSTVVTAVTSATTLTLQDDIFALVGSNYAVYDEGQYKDVERISNGKITMLLNSILTAPSLMFPAYTQTDGEIVTYPKYLGGYGTVKATYFRYPKDPKWTYTTLANGEPVFNQSQPDYQDFEMPLEDEFKLVMKILQYAGVSIREAEVTGFAIAQEQHEQPTFSQQQ